MPAAKTQPTPFYIKLALVLVSIIASAYIAILGQKILAPLLFSMLFAMLLLPLANFLELKLKLPRGAAAMLSVLMLIASISFIFYEVGYQISNLADDWPMFNKQLTIATNNLQHWVASTFHVNIKKQQTYINDAASSFISTGTVVLSGLVQSISSIMFFLVFIMIDTFFLLYYRRLIVKFLVAVFKEENSVIVYDIIRNVQAIIRNYIVGLLIEMLVVATATSTALLILGANYAILLGLIAGLFNVIPYIGIFTALVISVLITFATATAASTILFVAIIILGIHLIDSNFLFPAIVGSKVRINALITILGAVIGEMLWGIPGMFLAIPVIAIAKIIFDRIDSLKPWGLILGDEKEINHPKKLIIHPNTGEKIASGEE
jgi:putative permease